MASESHGPTMGWSSWNTYRVNITDSLIIRQADALVATGLREVGYEYINIDDGFFGGRDKNGRLMFHPERFPHGLAPVVDHIHSHGLKAGIYSDAGRNTCGNYWDNDTIARGVGLYGHDEQDAALFFTELGFDFIKVDFCGGDAKQNHENLQLNEFRRYEEISKAIEATGRNDVRLNICRWDFPGTWASKLAFSWRISHDITDRWASVRVIIAQNLYLSAYCRNGHFNDMDMLEVGRSLTPDEDVTHFGLWCMMCSPLLIGCDLTTLRPETLRLISNPELIALNQDRLHRQAYVARRTGDGFLLVKDIEEENSIVRAVALYNASDQPVQMTLRAMDVELQGPVKLRDLVSRSDAGRFKDSMLVSIPAHGVRIFRAEGERRLMRRRYEAETAFIPSYQELTDHQEARTGWYEADSRCSGGMKAAWLGASEESCLIWDDVWMPEAGEFEVTVACVAEQPARAFLTVNELPVGEMSLVETDGVITVMFRARFEKGKNRMKLSNPESAMPDIDYLEITKP